MVWQRSAVSPLIGTWWAATVTLELVARAYGAVSSNPGALALVAIAQSVTLILLVTAISRRQDDRMSFLMGWGRPAE